MTNIINPFLQAKGYKQKLSILRSISKDIKNLNSTFVLIGNQTIEQVENAETLNDKLCSYYFGDTNRENINTYNGWKKQGYKVKKGEKSVLVWSKPIIVKKSEEKDENKEDEKEYTGYRASYVFYKSQVEPIN